MFKYFQPLLNPSPSLCVFPLYAHWHVLFMDRFWKQEYLLSGLQISEFPDCCQVAEWRSLASCGVSSHQNPDIWSRKHNYPHKVWYQTTFILWCGRWKKVYNLILLLIFTTVPALLKTWNVITNFMPIILQTWFWITALVEIPLSKLPIPNPLKSATED